MLDVSLVLLLGYLYESGPLLAHSYEIMLAALGISGRRRRQVVCENSIARANLLGILIHGIGFVLFTGKQIQGRAIELLAVYESCLLYRVKAVLLFGQI